MSVSPRILIGNDWFGGRNNSQALLLNGIILIDSTENHSGR
jgi:hypothetical protein